MATRSSQLALFGNSVLPKLPDITRRKHHGNKQSEQANERAFPSAAAMRERIRLFISGCEHHGATSKEIGRAFGEIPIHKFSGRLSELKSEGIVFESGRERENCAVLVAEKKWVNGKA